MCDANKQIWERSRKLSAPFWDSYNRLFISKQTTLFTSRPSESVHESIDDSEPEEDPIELEYQEFIKITRKHQLERDRLKKIELESKKLLPEEYYTDISHVNTLVVDNLNQAPSQLNCKKKQNSYSEKIRSMEMSIDEVFKTKCQELAPTYWPIIPINPRPYLNPIQD